MGKRKGGNSNYNYNKAKRRRKNVLESGMRGFLCTCNVKEKECVREAYNILNDYGDKLYGEEELSGKSTNPSENADDNVEGSDNINEGSIDDCGEIEDELKKEVESLKTKSDSESSKERRFQQVESGANNCIFIKTTVDDPVHLITDIMNDVYNTQKKISRHLIRLIPIEMTCKVYIDDIKKECEKLFEKHFKCEPTTYGIAYNKRYNDHILRTEVIESLARLIQDRNVLHKVDLRQAKKTVVVEIIKNVCCVSVVPDYYKLKKYNLFELTKKMDDEKIQNELNDENNKTLSDNQEKMFDKGKGSDDEMNVNIQKDIDKNLLLDQEETQSELNKNNKTLSDNEEKTFDKGKGTDDEMNVNIQKDIDKNLLLDQEETDILNSTVT